MKLTERMAGWPQSVYSIVSLNLNIIATSAWSNFYFRNSTKTQHNNVMHYVVHFIIMIGSNGRVTYTGLDPGNYFLRIISRSRCGGRREVLRRTIWIGK